MSFDLVVYIKHPLSEMIDIWEQRLIEIDETAYFDSQAKEEIKQNREFSGWFPVGDQGFELYIQDVMDEEISDPAAPPQIANTRYALTISMSNDHLRKGYFCAGALALVNEGVILDTYEGTYLSPEQAIIIGREMPE